MSIQPKISVIMPVFNAEKYLKQAIDSILYQTYDNFEFIILNDGSTDSSEEIILSYNDSRIVYIKNNNNIRLIKTLNKGIHIAKGEYIARMDADDICFLNRFEKQVEVLEKKQDIHVVASPVHFMYEDGRLSKKLTKRYSSEAIKLISPFACVITHPSVMIRSHVLKSNVYSDLADNEHIEDSELWLRLLFSNSVFYMTEFPLLYYRMNLSGVSYTNRMLQADRYASLSKEILKNQYSFDCSKQLLYCIHFKIREYNVGMLFDLDRMLCCYLKIAIEKNSFTTDVVCEFNSWKRKILAGAALSSLRAVSIKNKIDVLVYIFYRFYWIKTFCVIVKNYWIKSKFE